MSKAKPILLYTPRLEVFVSSCSIYKIKWQKINILAWKMLKGTMPTVKLQGVLEMFVAFLL